LGWSIFTAVIIALGAYFGPQSITYRRLRPFLVRPNNSPPRGWSSVPQELTDTTASMAKGATISFYGYRFDVPWKEIDKQWNEGRSVKVLFKTGQVLRFNNPEYFDWSPINSFSGQIDQISFRRAFGTGIDQTKYEQFQSVISVAPSQLTPLCSHRTFARIRTLLEIKGLWFEHSTAAPDVFSFETKDYRGFENSGLPHDWQNVVLHLFDRRDRHWFTVAIEVDPRFDVKLTQAEVNRVIQSFREAPSYKPNQPQQVERH